LAALRLTLATIMAALHTTDIRHLLIPAGFEGDFRGSVCERCIWFEGSSFWRSNRIPHFTRI